METPGLKPRFGQERGATMSEQEHETQEEEETSEGQEVKDLDVPEEESKDVTGGVKVDQDFH
jgi:hypothetical protein